MRMLTSIGKCAKKNCIYCFSIQWHYCNNKGRHCHHQHHIKDCAKWHTRQTKARQEIPKWLERAPWAWTTGYYWTSVKEKAIAVAPRLNKMLWCEPQTPNINTIYPVLSVTIKLLRVFEGTGFPQVQRLWISAAWICLYSELKALHTWMSQCNPR